MKIKLWFVIFFILIIQNCDTDSTIPIIPEEYFLGIWKRNNENLFFEFGENNIFYFHDNPNSLWWETLRLSSKWYLGRVDGRTYISIEDIPEYSFKVLSHDSIKFTTPNHIFYKYIK